MTLTIVSRIIFSLDEIETAAAKCLAAIKGRMVVAFHGAMGAGKTTLIKLLLGMYPPTKGTYKISIKTAPL